MSNNYFLTSQNSSIPTNVLMSGVRGTSGESKLAIEPISQCYILYIENISANSETELDLSKINFDYLLKSIFWSNVLNDNISSDILIRLKDSLNNTIKKFDFSARNLDSGVGFANKTLPILSEQKITVESDFDIDRLTFVIEPAIILDKLNVG